MVRKEEKLMFLRCFSSSFLFQGDFMGQYFENDNNLPSNITRTESFILGKKFTFFTDNGVFSKDGLDFGSRLLLETIPLEEVGGKVLDMGYDQEDRPADQSQQTDGRCFPQMSVQ